MKDKLINSGYIEGTENDSDIYIINTCTVTNTSDNNTNNTNITNNSSNNTSIDNSLFSIENIIILALSLIIGFLAIVLIDTIRNR
jgi:hypothetical protein